MKKLGLIIIALLNLTIIKSQVIETDLHVCVPILYNNIITINKAENNNTAAITSIKNRKWDKGQTIRIKFMNGNAYLQNKVIKYSIEWTKYANLNFKFVTSGYAEIRIAFNSGGSYSYIGKDALNIPQIEHTMNFGWFDNNTDELEFSRTIIHEFGHAIGLIHEHQHPENNIPWNKPVVYSYYAQTQNPPWTIEDVNRNIFDRFSSSITQYSQYDKNSIMHYSIPASHLLNPSFAVGWNNKLSNTDKSFIETIYGQSKFIPADINDKGYDTHVKFYYDINNDGRLDYGRLVGGKNVFDKNNVFLSFDLSTNNGGWIKHGFTSRKGIDFGYLNGEGPFLKDVNNDGYLDFCREIGNRPKSYYAAILGTSTGFNSLEYYRF